MTEQEQREMEEVLGRASTHAPTMGNLDKVRYTHLDMIDFIIAHPSCNRH